MAIFLTDALRNAMLDEITTKIDAGAGAGTVKIYDGSVPADESTALSGNTLLATLTCSDPSSAAASGGVLTLSSITDDSSADATGTASFFRVQDSNSVVVMQGSVGTSGADMNFSTVSFVAGQPVSITSWTITAPH